MTVTTEASADNDAAVASTDTTRDLADSKLATAWELPGWQPPESADVLSDEIMSALEKYRGEKLLMFLKGRLEEAPTA